MLILLLLVSCSKEEDVQENIGGVVRVTFEKHNTIIDSLFVNKTKKPVPYNNMLVNRNNILTLYVSKENKNDKAEISLRFDDRNTQTYSVPSKIKIKI